MNTVIEDQPRRHRITVDEYYRMAEVGLLARDARVELVHGEVIEMPPIGSMHGGMVVRLGQLLTSAVGPRGMLRPQLPLRLCVNSEPQPDLMVVKPRSDFYQMAHPTADDTLLLVEISDSTFKYDRNTKVPLYASHAIPETWIVDLRRRQVFFFRSPENGTYMDVSTAGAPDHVPLAALPGVTVDLSSLWKT